MADSERAREAKEWFLRGCRFESDGAEPGLPAEAYRRSIGVDSDFAGAYVNLGFVHIRLKEYGEALKCFARVAELEPHNPESFNNLGYAYECMERLGSARTSYEQALRVDPGNIEAVINLAHIAELQGNYHGAVGNYRRAIEMDPGCTSARFCLGVLYDRYDMFDEAEESYAGVLERDPGHLKAMLNLANIRMQLGDDDGAEDLLRRILETHAAKGSGKPSAEADPDPLLEDVQVNLARVQLLRSRAGPGGPGREDALRRLRSILNLNPRNVRAGNMLREFENYAG